MQKCSWSFQNEILKAYHDNEYGKLKTATNELFKWLSLEGMQAGLSWLTVLKLEGAYDEYFANFAVDKVRNYSVEDLLKNLEVAKIIKNKLKVQAVVHNAQIIYEIEKEMKFFDYLISLFDMRLTLDQNILLIVKKMKKRGFKFVGYEILKSFFESVGIIVSHDKNCAFYRKPYLSLKQCRGSYHVHTKYCGHAIGEVSDYVEMAIEKGITHLGISCHVPLDEKYVFYGTHQTRMYRSDLDSYINDIDEVIEKYHQKIKIYKAFECDNLVNYFDEYEKYLTKYNFDYFLLSNHFNPQTGVPFSKEQSISTKEYLDLFTSSIKTGMFSVIAHLDAFKRDCDELSQEVRDAIARLCHACKKYGVALELNTNRIGRNHHRNKPYVWYEFWQEVAKFQTEVVINDDAHRPLDLETEWTDYAYKLAEDLGLNVVEKIRIIKS